MGWLSVACVDDGLEEDFGTTSQEVAAPAPQNLVIASATAVNVTLSWDSIGLAGEKYVIYRGTDATTQTVYTSNYPESATTFKDTNLTPNTQYCYHVRSGATGFTLSGPSNVVCTTTTTGATPPTNVTATATSSSTITVSWNPVANATAYYIYMLVSGAYENIGSVNSPTTQFTAGGLSPGTSYTFVVRSQIQTTLSANSEPASATTFPLGLEAWYPFDDVSGTTAADLSGYDRDATLSGGAAFITTDEAPLKNENDQNDSAVAFPTGTSQVSAPVVKNFIDNASISLWVKRTATATDFNIVGRRGAGCGAISWLLGHNAQGLYFAGQSGQIFFGQALPTTNQWRHVGVVRNGGNFELYVSGSLVSTQAYDPGNVTNTGEPMHFGNVGGCGTGGSLRVDEFKMWSRALTASEMAELGTPPPAPTNLRATEIKSQRVTIAWDSVPGAEKYHVYRGTAQGNATFLTTNNTNTFTLGNMQPSQTYWWWVVAVRGGLVGPKSNEIRTTTLPPPPAPTLSGTLATNFTPARVNLSWTSVDRAISYSIYRSTDNVTFSLIAQVEAPNTTLQATGHTAGTTYYYHVRSLDDGRHLSAPSNVVTMMIP